MRARTIGVSLRNEMKHFRVKDGQRFYSPARSRYFDGWRGGSAALDLKRDNSNKQPARPMRARPAGRRSLNFEGSIARVGVPALRRGRQRLGGEPASIYRAHIDEP